MVLVPTLAGVTAVVSLGFVVLGLWVSRRYRGIGVWSFSAFAVLWGANFLLNAAVVAVLHASGVSSGADLRALSVSRPAELFLLGATPLVELLIVVGIFAWLWFVLSYTTRLDRSDEFVILGAAVVVFSVTAVNALVGALSAFGHLQLDPRVQSDFHSFAGLIEILGTGIAVSAGAAQLYTASRRHRLFTLAGAVGLTLAVLLPYLVRYLYQFGLVVDFATIESLRLAALTVGLAGLWLTVSRHGLFDQLPASRAVGRDTAFDATEAAIVVLDDEDRISDLNAAASDLFDASPRQAIGEPIATLLPPSTDGVPAGDDALRVPNSDRVVEVEATRTTDDRDREIGRTVVFKDVTEERHRRQRIQVLNRVLRHNLRNDLTVAAGYVDRLAAATDGHDEEAATAREILDDLLETGDKARDVESMLAADPVLDTPRPLAGVVDAAVDRVQATRDDVAIETVIPEHVLVSANPDVLQRVLEELLENALEHGTTPNGTPPRVTFDADRTAVVVADAGPGIPDHEIDVFDRNRETALEHGSGLGLWLVKWGVDRLGGTIEFETDEEGTRVAVVLPAELVG